MRGRNASWRARTVQEGKRFAGWEWMEGAETHIEIDLEGSLSVLWWASAGTGASSNGKECQMKKCNLQPQCLTE